MEAATMDRIQRMIDDEAAERFPAGAVPRLVLLRYGDHPVIEPGELYLRVTAGTDEASRDAWFEEHGDREPMIRALRREFEERTPGASYLEFWLDRKSVV